MRTISIGWALVGASALWRLATGVLLTIDADEFQALHSAWLIDQGRTPYRDFVGMHSPGLWYLLQPLVHLTGGGSLQILAGRLLAWVLMSGTVWACSRLAARLFGSEAGWPAAMAASLYPPLMIYGGQLTTVVPATLLFVLALLAAAGPASKGPGVAAWVGSGMLAMAAFWFKQSPAFPALAGLFALCAAAWLPQRRSWLRAGAAFSLGAAVGALPVAAWLWWAGAWERFLTQAVLWHFDRWFPLPPLPFLVAGALHNLLFPLAALLGLWLALRDHAAGSAARFGLPLVILGLMVAFLQLPRPAWTHLVTLYSLLAVPAGAGLVRVGRWLSEMAPGLLRLAAGLVLGASVLMAVLVPVTAEGLNRSQLVDLNLARSLTGPDDRVLSGIGMATDRQHVLDHWFTPPNSVMFYRQIGAMADAIRQNKVPVILWDPVLERLITVAPERVLATTLWAGREAELMPDLPEIHRAQQEMQELIARCYRPHERSTRVLLFHCRFGN